MKKILVVQPIHPRGMAILREGGEVVVPDDPSDGAIIRAGKDAEALVVRLTKVSRSLIEALPALRVIGRNGVGVDNVDLEAASARGIAVVNTPGSNANSVAEYVIASFMFMLKKIGELDREVRNGNWNSRDQVHGVDLEGRCLGIVGMGRIGSVLASKCIKGLGMRVVFYDPYVNDDDLQDVGASKCKDLDELLGQADVVSIHVPVTPTTRLLFDAERLRRMKKGSVLVNASRGGVVDEGALAMLLAEGHLGGAAVDVFDREPPAPDNPLFTAPNVLLTPHIAGMTDDAVIRTAEMVARGVVAVLNGQLPDNVCNRESLLKCRVTGS